MTSPENGIKKSKTLAFKLNYSLGVNLVNIDLKKEKPKKYWQPIPPYNGYGTEEDSLGSVFSLQNKPPKKDLTKMFTVKQKIRL
jgi:EF-hand domain-containing protein 1